MNKILTQTFRRSHQYIEMMRSSRILGVNLDSTPRQIRNAYRRKQFNCHPNKYPNSKTKKIEYDRITRAYKILCYHVGDHEEEEDFNKNSQVRVVTQRTQAGMKNGAAQNTNSGLTPHVKIQQLHVDDTSEYFKNPDLVMFNHTLFKKEIKKDVNFEKGKAFCYHHKKCGPRFQKI